MSVNSTNLVLGPATIYVGAFGAAEPADAAVNTTPASSAWTDIGATLDGIDLVVVQNFKILDADQSVMALGARLTTRGLTVATKVAEATLNNMAMLLNAVPPVSGSGYSTLEPTVDTSATQPIYRALIVDGWAPNSLRRRLIIRKTLSTDDIKSSYAKDGQTVYTVTWTAYYVTPSILPFKIVDQTS
jgi:hypothetical protein